MNRFFALSLLLLTCQLVTARARMNTDTAKKTAAKGDNAAVAFEPEYPGGITAFNSYIKRNLHYPDAARLMCINGKVYVSFVVDRDGRVTNVTALNCIGAGCESEAVRVVQRSKSWKPGTQHGRAVAVNYTVPIDFHMEKEKVYMENLAASDYGFIFNIEGRLYSVDEAEDILGKTFLPEKIAIAEPFSDYNKNQKFQLRHKKQVYLLVIKPSSK
jgi:periplasmic protein TonB